MNQTILHTIDTTGPGGAETVFLQLAELQISNYSNYVLIKGPGWVEDQLKNRNIRYYVIKPKGFLSIPYYWQLLKLLRKNNTVLVQAHLLGSALTFSLLRFFTGIPLVATLHGQVDVNPSERWLWIKRKIMRFGISQLITVSCDLRDYIHRRNLFPSSKVKIIYNGIDKKKYEVENSYRLRRELGISNDALLIGSLGNVRPAKNYSFLLDIASNMTTTSSRKLHFIIAGHQKESLMCELNQKIRDLNLGSCVHFIGFQNDTAEYLRQLDIFLLTSSSEGFSIATIEAMASELPVVATRCGGPEEILKDTASGILIDKDDLSGAVKNLQALCENIEKRKAMGLAGKEYVNETFSADTMYAAYQQIYKSHLK